MRNWACDHQPTGSPEALPRGTYQRIDNARHLIPLEAPEPFRAALIDF